MKRFAVLLISLSLCSCASTQKINQRDITWFAAFLAGLAVRTVNPLAGGIVSLTNFPIDFLLENRDGNGHEPEQIAPVNKEDDKQ